MAGYQFIHVEAYSRSGGKGGKSVGYVLDEVERKPGAHPHVIQPQPPQVLHGMAVGDLRKLHDEGCLTARQTVAGGKERAIRGDQKTLLTIVASYPIARADLAGDETAKMALRDWERRTVAWLKDRYGDELRTVVRHVDETYPHLHAYVVPRNMRASSLHDGMAAKTALMAATAVSSDPDERKARNKAGDLAYREAMRGFQTSYNEAVGKPCGLARLGPGRRRLSRAEWQTEKVAAEALLSARITAHDVRNRLRSESETFVARTKAKAEKVAQEASKRLQEASGKLAEAQELQRAAAADRRAAKALRTEAAVSRREASEALSGVRTLGGLVGSAIGVVRDTLGGRQAAFETEKLQIEEDAAKRVRQVEQEAVESRTTLAEKLAAERRRNEALASNLSDTIRQRDEAWRQISDQRPSPVLGTTPRLG